MRGGGDADSVDRARNQRETETPARRTQGSLSRRFNLLSSKKGTIQMTRRITFLAILSVFMLIVAACEAQDEDDATADDNSADVEEVQDDPEPETVDDDDAEDEEEPTATAEPTATEEPTPEPEPTATPEPTEAPEPTATPAPTATAQPTATPEPPPEPVNYAGNGDDVLTIDKPGGPESPALAFVRGNSEASHFAVSAFDAQGDQVALLVNTTDPYEGLVPLDFMDSEETTQLEISSSGEWEIELRPLESLEIQNVPGEASGSGDHVFGIDGNSPTAHIDGNAGETHFAVAGYGNGWNLLVNTTDQYRGRVMLPSDVWIIEVDAEGPWRIVFEE